MDQTETLTIEDAQIESLSMPTHVEFPMLILIIALFKDISDMGSLGMLGFITSFLFGMIIYLWIFNKSSLIQRMLWKRRARLIIVFIIGIIPIINFIPESIILVLLVYSHEKAIVKHFFDKLERTYHIG